ncbi:MAG: MscL family protein, partial [Oscillospiraceae bacterium]|nr:MscL family protein [Oscillospiraceae bacterium]
FMPLISWIFGARDMTALNVIVRPAELDASGEVVKEAITLGFGTFLATIIDFILVALVVFAIVKSFNKARELAKKKEEEAPAAPPEPSAEEKLLTEIRDLLKDQK